MAAGHAQEKALPLSHRTMAIGDIHGEFAHLARLCERLPRLDSEDTLVFLGDFVDRGPESARVVDFVRRHLAAQTSARVVALRGSHEDAWLQARREGYLDFILPAQNGCLASLLSFSGRPPLAEGEAPSLADYQSMERATFFPDGVMAWMDGLAIYHEDEHAIYVHAGLPQIEGRFLHPKDVVDPKPLFWQRSQAFFENYRGKRVVFGHTSTEYLPQELSCNTPDVLNDVFISDTLVGIDTGCGRGGFLSAIELPSLTVYDSRV
jgi:serine/threonine protein phosphatase 1